MCFEGGERDRSSSKRVLSYSQTITAYGCLGVLAGTPRGRLSGLKREERENHCRKTFRSTPSPLPSNDVGVLLIHVEKVYPVRGLGALEAALSARLR